MTGRDFLAGRALGLNAAETATLVEAIADGHVPEDDLARPVGVAPTAPYPHAPKPAMTEEWGVRDDDGQVIPDDGWEGGTPNWVKEGRVPPWFTRVHRYVTPWAEVES